MTYLREQLVGQLRRRPHLVVAKHLFKLSLSKRIPVAILRFRQAIGVKQEAIARFDPQLTQGIVRVWNHSKQQPIAFNAR